LEVSLFPRSEAGLATKEGIEELRMAGKAWTFRRGSFDTGLAHLLGFSKSLKASFTYNGCMAAASKASRVFCGNGGSFTSFHPPVATVEERVEAAVTDDTWISFSAT